LKFISFFLLLLSILVFGKPAYAFTDNFDVSIEPDALTQVVSPGKSYSLSVDLDTSNTNLTAYPVAFDLPGSGDYSTSDSWITFGLSSLTLNNAGSTTLNFTLTIPQDTYNGEYTKAVGVADMPYSDAESDNPPIVLGIPITVQVSGGKDRPSTSTSTSSTPTPTPIASATPTPTKKTVTKTPEIEPPKADLYSEVKLISFRSFFNPLNQTQTFKLKLKNEGNISSIPNGFVNIVNSQNQQVAQLIINESELPIRPDSQSEYQLNFKSEEFLLGRFKAEVWLGYQNTQKQVEPTLEESIYFYYMSPQPLTIVALTFLISIFLLKIRLPHLHFKAHYRYFSIFLIIAVNSGLLLYFYKTAERQTEKSLGVQTQLTVTATVKQSIGMKTVMLNDSKLIYLTGSNKKGVKLFSLQKKSRQVLAEQSEPSATLTSYTLSGTQARFPILCFTRGY
jgi:hypothetical protein